MANANITLDNPHKLVVAIDIVSYFMKKKNPHLTAIFQDPSIASAAEDCRKNSPTAFVNYRGALNFMDKKQAVLVRRDFQEFLSKGLVCKNSFIDYGCRYKHVCFDDGIKACNFFMYCARIAVMACCFYDNGVMDAPDVAVELIVSAYSDDLNLNWTDLDLAAQNYTIRESKGITSSESEESSSDSMSVCESESSSTDKLQQSEGCFGMQSSSSVTPSMEVKSLAVKVGEQRISNLEQSSAVTEQTGGCSSLATVPITKSSSGSPGRRVILKDEFSHSPSKSLSDEFTKLSSSLGKRRSAEGSVSPNIPGTDVTGKIFASSEPKKSKIQDDKSE